MIVKVPGGWRIRSHMTGKVYPKIYSTAESARKRIRQLMMFKRIKGG